MEYYAELKILGDPYCSGFANGLTMCGSESTKNFVKCYQNKQMTRYEDVRGYNIALTTKQQQDAMMITTTFSNESNHEVKLEMMSSFAIKGVKADRVHRLQTFWSAEGKLRTETIDELHLEPSWNRCGMRVEKFGNIGSMPVRKYFPFIVLEDSINQKFIGIQLYCPSSWQIELLCKDDDTLTVVGGIADRDFGQWMKSIQPGESFTSPRAIVAFGGSIYEVCDRLVKAQSPDISNVDDTMGIVFNEYCTTWGNPTFENVKKIADKLKGKGIQYLVIDSGWYGTGDYWWNSIGDWEVNLERFPGGMKPIADYIRSCGMIPGLWYEFESLSKNSKYYEATQHLVKRDGVPVTVGERRFFDMADPWVIDYLSEKVIGLLKECGFGYLKVDYNDTIGMGCDGAESLGEGLRQRVEATQEFFKKIKRELPDLVIENCSSGGHRLEPSMMELVSQASFSDAHETKAIPLIAANMHRVIPPYQSQIWAVMRSTDSDERIFYSLISTFLGRMCLSGDIYDLSEHQWNLIEEGMDFYKEASEIIQYGTTILCEYDTKNYNNPTGEQIVIRKYGKKYLAVVHRFGESKAVDTTFLEGVNVYREYGSMESDFSAKAWLYEN